MTLPRNLGDRLSELEPIHPERRARYEQSVKDLFERRLPPLMKLFIGIVGVGSIGIAIFLVSNSVMHPRLPALAHVGLAGGAVLSLLWAVLCGWTLYKGSWYSKLQPTAIAALGWVLAVFMETLFLVLAPAAPDPYLWTVAIFAGLVILIGAGVQLVTTRLQQTELSMRESFLRMEYRLADLAEQVSRPQSSN
jgi:hypothetical protein